MNSQDLFTQKLCPLTLQNENEKSKKRVFFAFLLTLVAMVAEIIAGSIFNSMALLADGWHMSSHALALGLAFLTYVLANFYAKDLRFSFGSFKIEILSAYSSALFLLGIAFFMAYESIERLVNPKEIAYKEAIIVAVIGLFVNLFCMWLLRDEEHSHEIHKHKTHTHKAKDKKAQDLNLKAAYIHVLSDALTSIFAIIALFSGFWLGIWWLDSVMGIVGSLLVLVWALGLLKQSSKILLDMSMDKELVNEILLLAKNFGEIKDLHLLQVSKDKYACVLSIKSQRNLDELKVQFSKCKQLAHLTIEKLDESI